MLTAISPVDGRYASKTAELSPYFSEYALIKERLNIEVEYLITLSRLGLPQLPPIDSDDAGRLRSLARHLAVSEAEKVKQIEQTTNHDVKAVEYYLKNVLDEMGLDSYKEWVHFALTSQDVNNTSVPLLIRRSIHDVIKPALESVVTELKTLEARWIDIPMLAHTHGQPASPTTVGKEVRVFRERLESQNEKLDKLIHYGKFGGATGNFNAHLAAYPDIDWVRFGDEFLESVGLRRIATTTQIDHYDHLAELMHVMIRLSSILKDLCIDFWLYISMEYFRQKTVAGEIGSSSMPHKVNPIDFENAEGNLGIAVVLFDHLATKLPVSRMQRDLTDSTVLRNVGVPFAHFLISLKSLMKGLGKLELNKAKLETDLEKNWAVVAEAIQTILRREGVEKPYELLKDLTRGNALITKASIHDFIDNLDLKDSVKREMKQITPQNYTGITR